MLYCLEHHSVSQLFSFNSFTIPDCISQREIERYVQLRDETRRQEFQVSSDTLPDEHRVYLVLPYIYVVIRAIESISRIVMGMFCSLTG